MEKEFQILKKKFNMKKILKFLISVFLLILIIWPIYYFVTKKNNKEITYSLMKPEKRDLKNFIICSGVILPKEEAEIKSRVSGVLENLYVQNGDRVSKGQIIAEIGIIPDMGELVVSESGVNIAKINFDNQNVSYNRNKILLEKGIIPKAEFEKIENEFLNTKEQLNNARKKYRIIKLGNYSNVQKSNTSITSTIDGIVTLLPTKIGASIIQSNNFSEGTTIAKISNIEKMIFEGNVKEYEVAKLNEGMNVIINTAISDKNEKGVLSEISTSGKNIDGMILFDIKVELIDAKISKTGFSANAKIITNEKKNVLTIREEWINVKNDSTYVLMKNNNDEDGKRLIELGFSDGIFTEVLSGLNVNETIIVYDK